MTKRFVFAWMAALCCLMMPTLGRATQTENDGIRVLPAPGKVVVDGKANDWDLSGGLLICDDVETQRDRLGTWLFAMYDSKNLYILAHFLDETPLNNPGQTIADYGWNGDCLQLRFTMSPNTPDERTSHWTMWQGSDKKDVMNVVYGKKFDKGSIRDAKVDGAQQAFSIDADKKGYIQEIAIPWKLLTKDGAALTAGSVFNMTAEPNFTVGVNGRMSIKDIFKPGVTPDRVFTFMASNIWGPATLLPKGNVHPGPERLSDGREFKMSMQNGWPVIDWTGLIQTKVMPGFKIISFNMPQDGYISLHIQAKDGTVVRQLLNQAFYTKGPHEVKWDGLTTPNWNDPGQPVPPGAYTYSALAYSDIGLKLRGFADNGGSTAWDNGPSTNWGGDEGTPIATASDDKQVYLGWSFAEAGKSLLATDLQGNVKWKNNRGGMAGVKAVASDGQTVYVMGGAAGIASEGGAVYKLSAADGRYQAWGNSPDADLTVKTLWTEPGAPTLTGVATPPEKADQITARDGKFYLSFPDVSKILVVDSNTGQLTGSLDVSNPSAMVAAADGLYVLSGGKSVVRVNLATQRATTVVDGLVNATALAVGPDGKIYVGVGDPDNQVKVFTPDGKPAGTIGRQGGRALLGKWTPDGMRFISSITVAPDGKLWVAENDWFPKRISAWDTKTGQLWKEFFGPTSYGALGGAINPQDPDDMVGQGCEWRLDPTTGRASCVAVITRDGMEVSRFAIGDHGRLYLFVAPGWAHGSNFISIFERVGEANWPLRAKFIFNTTDKQHPTTTYWADANGDGKIQPDEETTVDGRLLFSGWYMSVTPDLTIYYNEKRYRLTGFTAAGAPLYDLSHPDDFGIPPTQAGMGATSGLGSVDGKLFLTNGAYAKDRSWFTAYNTTTGKVMWSYPNNFVGVHGSHNACPPEPGMIRGAYDIVGVAKLPNPIGGVFVIPTNVGEWHILTDSGFYLTRLFQGDPLKFQWPAQAVPGADMSNVPCGMGGEDFGGSIAQGKDGELYVQAGKTGFWNLQVTGLDGVKAIPGGTITITPADVIKAQDMHDAQLQAAVGIHKITVVQLTPRFTGNFDDDFKGANIATYSKQSDAVVRTALSWDRDNLYVAWDVKDNTPWLNSATDPAQMYIGGDTVDLQLGTDPKANPKRTTPVEGDLRISIGNYQGNPTAVIYRKVSRVKRPMVFSSGVVHAYSMDYVDILKDLPIKVTVRPGVGYVVEAAIPLTTLGFTPTDGMVLQGDFGATYGDPSGGRTRLRTYWNNQHTGIVDDAVFELQMEPNYWGQITFSK